MRFGHYVVGVLFISIGIGVFLKGRVEIEGIGLAIEGPFARIVGAIVILIGFLTVTSGRSDWFGF